MRCFNIISFFFRKTVDDDDHNFDLNSYSTASKLPNHSQNSTILLFFSSSSRLSVDCCYSCHFSTIKLVLSLDLRPFVLLQLYQCCFEPASI